MNAQPKDGDRVLVRGVYLETEDGSPVPFRSVVVGTAERAFNIPLEHIDIVSVEKPNFQVGDRVIAKSFPGVILCMWPDGDLAWVKPDSGTKEPWTVAVRDMVREPPAPPSAEVVELHGAAQRPCDTEAPV